MGSCTSSSFDVVSGKDESHSITGSPDECVVESGLNPLIWFCAEKLSAVYHPRVTVHCCYLHFPVQMNEWLECEVDCTTTGLVQLQVCRQVYKVLLSSKYKIVFINKSSMSYESHQPMQSQYS